MNAARLVALPLAAVLAIAAPAAAQARGAAPGSEAESAATTGDAWIDTRLADMDVYAARYRQAFDDEIVRYLQAPRALVEEAPAEGGMRPGEVYYACALAQASGRACRGLVEAWREDDAGSWAGVASRLGLEPDARYNRRIRAAIAASYRRWERPLAGP